MSDDMLSQDDIDALMSGLGGDDGDDSSEESSAVSVDPEDTRAFFNLLFEQSSSVVTTVVSKNVDIKLDQLQAPTTESVSEGFSEDCLWVKVPMESELSGNLYAIISKKNAAMLADLMMMGDGSAEFEEDHKDALSELMNQIMGSMVTASSEKFSLTLGVGQSETGDWNPEDIPFSLDDCVQTIANMRVEEIADTKVMFIADADMTASLHNHFAAPVESEEDSNSDMDVTSESSFASPAGMGGAPSQSSFDPGGVQETPFESSGNKAMDMLLDINLDLTIELGRTRMSLKKILEMGPGSIVEMDRFAGEPVDILIGDKVVARGEVVVVDENFGIRIVSLVTPEERLNLLK